MLTGQAKTDYQREYMRKRRARLELGAKLAGPVVLDPEPSTPLDLQLDPHPVRPELDPEQAETVITDCNDCSRMRHDQQTGLSCPRGKWQTSVKDIFIASINPDADCNEP